MIWITQQLKAFPFQAKARYLIFDRDAKYGFREPEIHYEAGTKVEIHLRQPRRGTKMPVTRAGERPTTTSEQIQSLIGAIEAPHDLCLMCIGLFCATRTSETLGLQWKSYLGDRLVILSTAYEGELYRGRVKTGASRSAVPIPDDIIPVVEAWRRECPDPSPEALMFPTFGRAERKGRKVPRRAKNFLKWRIYPIADKLKIPRKLVTFQVMRRTLGTDLQKHGTMKDARSFASRQHQDHS